MPSDRLTLSDRRELRGLGWPRSLYRRDKAPRPDSMPDHNIPEMHSNMQVPLESER